MPPDEWFGELTGDPLGSPVRDLGPAIERLRHLSVSRVGSALRRHAEPTFRIRPAEKVALAN